MNSLGTIEIGWKAVGSLAKFPTGVKPFMIPWIALGAHAAKLGDPSRPLGPIVLQIVVREGIPLTAARPGFQIVTRGALDAQLPHELFEIGFGMGQSGDVLQ